MSLHRKNYIAEGGERFGLLINSLGLPDFWTTLFLTTNVRSEKHTTQKAYLNHLAHIYIWEMSIGERISERIIRAASQKNMSSQVLFFSDLEIQKLRDHCKLTTKEARRNLRKKTEHRSNDQNLKIIFPIRKIPAATVEKEHAINRITIFANFFEFVAINILRNKPSFYNYLDIIENTKAQILKQKERYGGSKTRSSDPNKKAPHPDIFKHVMEIAEPSNIYNPYTKSVRQRNYLLLWMLYETGMRAGEVLQLKVSDIDFARNVVQIQSRHDDPEDKFRTDEPNAKTLERDLPINQDLSDQLRKYVLEERRFIPNAHTHKFLFISHKGVSKGHPLSLTQFSRIVEKISGNEELADFIKKNGFVVKKRVTRHGFRHDFNNRFSNNIDEHNHKASQDGRIDEVISEKKEIQQRMYINGHKSEHSAQVYNLRHTKEQAEKLLKRELEKMDSYIKKGQEK